MWMSLRNQCEMNQSYDYVQTSIMAEHLAYMQDLTLGIADQYAPQPFGVGLAQQLSSPSLLYHPQTHMLQSMDTLPGMELVNSALEEKTSVGCTYMPQQGIIGSSGPLQQAASASFYGQSPMVPHAAYPHMATAPYPRDSTVLSQNSQLHVSLDTSAVHQPTLAPPIRRLGYGGYNVAPGAQPPPLFGSPPALQRAPMMNGLKSAGSLPISGAVSVSKQNFLSTTSAAKNMTSGHDLLATNLLSSVQAGAEGYLVSAEQNRLVECNGLVSCASVELSRTLTSNSKPESRMPGSYSSKPCVGSPLNPSVPGSSAIVEFGASVAPALYPWSSYETQASSFSDAVKMSSSNSISGSSFGLLAHKINSAPAVIEVQDMVDSSLLWSTCGSPLSGGALPGGLFDEDGLIDPALISDEDDDVNLGNFLASRQPEGQSSSSQVDRQKISSFSKDLKVYSSACPPTSACVSSDRLSACAGRLSFPDGPSVTASAAQKSTGNASKTAVTSNGITSKTKCIPDLSILKSPSAVSSSRFSDASIVDSAEVPVSPGTSVSSSRVKLASISPRISREVRKDYFGFGDEVEKWRSDDESFTSKASSSLADRPSAAWRGTNLSAPYVSECDEFPELDQVSKTSDISQAPGTCTLSHGQAGVSQVPSHVLRATDSIATMAKTANRGDSAVAHENRPSHQASLQSETLSGETYKDAGQADVSDISKSYISVDSIVFASDKVSRLNLDQSSVVSLSPSSLPADENSVRSALHGKSTERTKDADLTSNEGVSNMELASCSKAPKHVSTAKRHKAHPKALTEQSFMVDLSELIGLNKRLAVRDNALSLQSDSTDKKRAKPSTSVEGVPASPSSHLQVTAMKVQGRRRNSIMPSRTSDIKATIVASGSSSRTATSNSSTTGISAQSNVNSRNRHLKSVPAKLATSGTKQTTSLQISKTSSPLPAATAGNILDFEKKLTTKKCFQSSQVLKSANSEQTALLSPVMGNSAVLASSILPGPGIAPEKVSVPKDPRLMKGTVTHEALPVPRDKVSSALRPALFSDGRSMAMATNTSSVGSVSIELIFCSACGKRHNPMSECIANVEIGKDRAANESRAGKGRKQSKRHIRRLSSAEDSAGSSILSLHSGNSTDVLKNASSLDSSMKRSNSAGSDQSLKGGSPSIRLSPKKEANIIFAVEHCYAKNGHVLEKKKVRIGNVDRIVVFKPPVKTSSALAGTAVTETQKEKLLSILTGRASERKWTQSFNKKRILSSRKESEMQDGFAQSVMSPLSGDSMEVVSFVPAAPTQSSHTSTASGELMAAPKREAEKSAQAVPKVDVKACSTSLEHNSKLSGLEALATASFPSSASIEGVEVAPAVGCAATIFHNNKRRLAKDASVFDNKAFHLAEQGIFPPVKEELSTKRVKRKRISKKAKKIRKKVLKNSKQKQQLGAEDAVAAGTHGCESEAREAVVTFLACEDAKACGIEQVVAAGLALKVVAAASTEGKVCFGNDAERSARKGKDCKSSVFASEYVSYGMVSENRYGKNSDAVCDDSQSAQSKPECLVNTESSCFGNQLLLKSEKVPSEAPAPQCTTSISSPTISDRCVFDKLRTRSPSHRLRRLKAPSEEVLTKALSPIMSLSEQKVNSAQLFAQAQPLVSGTLVKVITQPLPSVVSEPSGDHALCESAHVFVDEVKTVPLLPTAGGADSREVLPSPVSVVKCGSLSAKMVTATGSVTPISLALTITTAKVQHSQEDASLRPSVVATSPGDKPFKCRQCHAKFISEAELANHAFAHKVKTYDCYKCIEKFTTMRALTKHLLVHQDDHLNSNRLVMSSDLHEKLETDAQLLVQAKVPQGTENSAIDGDLSHGAVEISLCEECESGFGNVTELRTHLMRDHGMSARNAMAACKVKKAMPKAASVISARNKLTKTSGVNGQEAAMAKNIRRTSGAKNSVLVKAKAAVQRSMEAKQRGLARGSERIITRSRASRVAVGMGQSVMLDSATLSDALPTLQDSHQGNLSSGALKKDKEAAKGGFLARDTKPLGTGFGVTAPLPEKLPLTLPNSEVPPRKIVRGARALTMTNLKADLRHTDRHTKRTLHDTVESVFKPRPVEDAPVLEQTAIALGNTTDACEPIGSLTVLEALYDRLNSKSALERLFDRIHGAVCSGGSMDDAADAAENVSRRAPAALSRLVRKPGNRRKILLGMAQTFSVTGNISSNASGRASTVDELKFSGALSDAGTAPVSLPLGKAGSRRKLLIRSEQLFSRKAKRKADVYEGATSLSTADNPMLSCDPPAGDLIGAVSEKPLKRPVSMHDLDHIVDEKGKKVIPKATRGTPPCQRMSPAVESPMQPSSMLWSAVEDDGSTKSGKLKVHVKVTDVISEQSPPPLCSPPVGSVETIVPVSAKDFLATARIRQILKKKREREPDPQASAAIKRRRKKDLDGNLALVNEYAPLSGPPSEASSSPKCIVDKANAFEVATMISESGLCEEVTLLPTDIDMFKDYDFTSGSEAVEVFITDKDLLSCLQSLDDAVASELTRGGSSAEQSWILQRYTESCASSSVQDAIRTKEAKVEGQGISNAGQDLFDEVRICVQSVVEGVCKFATASVDTEAVLIVDCMLTAVSDYANAPGCRELVRGRSCGTVPGSNFEKEILMEPIPMSASSTSAYLPGASVGLSQTRRENECIPLRSRDSVRSPSFQRTVRRWLEDLIRRVVDNECRLSTASHQGAIMSGLQHKKIVGASLNSPLMAAECAVLGRTKTASLLSSSRRSNGSAPTSSKGTTSRGSRQGQPGNISSAVGTYRNQYQTRSRTKVSLPMTSSVESDENSVPANAICKDASVDRPHSACCTGSSQQQSDSRTSLSAALIKREIEGELCNATVISSAPTTYTVSLSQSEAVPSRQATIILPNEAASRSDGIRSTQSLWIRSCATQPLAVSQLENVGSSHASIVFGVPPSNSGPFSWIVVAPPSFCQPLPSGLVEHSGTSSLPRKIYPSEKTIRSSSHQHLPSDSYAISAYPVISCAAKPSLLVSTENSCLSYAGSNRCSGCIPDCRLGNSFSTSSLPQHKEAVIRRADTSKSVAISTGNSGCWHFARCPRCRKCFSSPSKLHKHALKASCKYVCISCKLDFSSEVSLLLHRKTTHEVVKSSMSCRRWGGVFAARKEMEGHEKLIHGSFECSVCSGVCSTRSALLRHTAFYHHGLALHGHACEICGRTFLRQCYLVSHMRRHWNVLPFRCFDCNRRFPTRCRLHQHLKSNHCRKSLIR